MRKILSFLVISATLLSCGTTRNITNENIELRYLDDYIIPQDLEIGGTKVGGISGIDFHQGDYFLVSDHPGNPRFYKTDIQISQNKIDTVVFSEVIQLDRSADFLKGKTLDLESIRFDAEENVFVITSEGSIANGKDPAIFIVTPEGDYISHFSLPDYFLASGKQKPRNNGVFEGLTESVDGKGFWTGMELPLEKDGSKPKLFPTKSPVRVTYFDKTGEATNQFVMQLEGITKFPWLYFAVNGLTELLEYEPNRFLVLERAFSAGHGSNGNTVRIFDVDAREATNTLPQENLKKTKYSAAKKTLIYDFKNVKKQLKEMIIDNLEGMTFGPELPNGNKTLLLASDNNFNSLGRQISQIILMEIIFKN
jgi:hypothetical protein